MRPLGKLRHVKLTKLIRPVLHVMVCLTAILYSKPPLNNSGIQGRDTILLSVIHSHWKPPRPFLQSFIHCVFFWPILFFFFYSFFNTLPFLLLASIFCTWFVSVVSKISCGCICYLVCTSCCNGIRSTTNIPC
jgi:hypothetical protein